MSELYRRALQFSNDVRRSRRQEIIQQSRSWTGNESVLLIVPLLFEKSEWEYLENLLDAGDVGLAPFRQQLSAYLRSLSAKSPLPLRLYQNGSQMTNQNCSINYYTLRLLNRLECMTKQEKTILLRFHLELLEWMDQFKTYSQFHLPLTIQLAHICGIQQNAQIVVALSQSIKWLYLSYKSESNRQAQKVAVSLLSLPAINAEWMKDPIHCNKQIIHWLIQLICNDFHSSSLVKAALTTLSLIIKHQITKETNILSEINIECLAANILVAIQSREIETMALALGIIMDVSFSRDDFIEVLLETTLPLSKSSLPELRIQGISEVPTQEFVDMNQKPQNGFEFLLGLRSHIVNSIRLRAFWIFSNIAALPISLHSRKIIKAIYCQKLIEKETDNEHINELILIVLNFACTQQPDKNDELAEWIGSTIIQTLKRTPVGEKGHSPLVMRALYAAYLLRELPGFQTKLAECTNVLEQLASSLQNQNATRIVEQLLKFINEETEVAPTLTES